MRTGKTVTVGTKSFDAMTAQLRRLHERVRGETVVPPGWFTAEQYAAATGIGMDAARMLLLRMGRAGELKSASYRINLSNAHSRMVNHYKVSRQKNKKSK